MKVIKQNIVIFVLCFICFGKLGAMQQPTAAGNDAQNPTQSQPANEQANQAQQSAAGNSTQPNGGQQAQNDGDRLQNLIDSNRHITQMIDVLVEHQNSQNGEGAGSQQINERLNGLAEQLCRNQEAIEAIRQRLERLSPQSPTGPTGQQIAVATTINAVSGAAATIGGAAVLHYLAQPRIVVNSSWWAAIWRRQATYTSGPAIWGWLASHPFRMRDWALVGAGGLAVGTMYSLYKYYYPPQSILRNNVNTHQ